MVARGSISGNAALPTVEVNGEYIISLVHAEDWRGSVKKEQVIDNGEVVVMPGLIDVHAQLDDPGRTEWEGFPSGTKSAAAGGITTLIDMPLNSFPSTVSEETLKLKVDAAEENIYVDVGFWGALVPENALNESMLERLLSAGALGLKSWERNISTFSGHISRVCKILEVASKESLVLIDEIESGTDPSEGVALSASILEYLKDSVNLAFITTHYVDLSCLKEKDAHFENAAMEFSLENLQPTYRILWGRTGASNALKIAKSIGFDDKIIECAQELVERLMPYKQHMWKGLLYQSLMEERNRLEVQAQAASSLHTEIMDLYHEAPILIKSGGGIHNYLYQLKSSSQGPGVFKVDGSNVLGKLQITLRTNLGEPRRLQTQQILGSPIACKEIGLLIKEVPPAIILERPFVELSRLPFSRVYLNLTNQTDRAMGPFEVWLSQSDCQEGQVVMVHGLRAMALPQVEAFCLTDFHLNLIATKLEFRKSQGSQYLTL